MEIADGAGPGQTRKGPVHKRASDFKIEQPHALTVQETADTLRVHLEDGLSHQEAGRRLQLVGHNALEASETTSAWGILLDQVRSTVVLVLAGSVVAGLLIGELIEAAAVAIVLVVNTIVGFVTELRAVRSMESLHQLASTYADVEREGRRDEIEAIRLVPGDLITVESGDRVPADLRLVNINDLSVEESALTGESEPVRKQVDAVADDAPLGDRLNMAFMGTTVRTGRAQGIVVATGMRTEIGRVADLTSRTSTTQAPLQVGLEQLGRTLSIAVVLLALCLAALGWARGLDLHEVFEISIALAVAIVPEGLPAVATLTLTVGMRRMAAENALVRRLPVVETLGSTTVIASDKTGTLTANRMTVADVTTFDEDLLWETAILCNDADIAPDGDAVGDPTEVALLLAASEREIDFRSLRERSQRLAEVPFDPRAKRMAVIVDGTTHAKGAPEVLIPFDSYRELQQAVEDMTDRGLRTLAIARGDVPDRFEELVADGRIDPDEADAIFACVEPIGVVGVHDPVRPQAVGAIETCHRAGIEVVMITGDQPRTAAVVASQLGLAPDPVMTGPELDRLDDDELRARVKDIDVYARVAPEHKLRIVRALQANGEIVAVTGDGVNDAPALKQADVGVAMGLSGTDVAREVADIVLMDDDFTTIEHAVEEGRRIFANIRRFGQFLFSWHLSVVLVITGALLLGLPAPLAGLVILWNNLIIDVIPSFALALEPSREDAMSRPPRPRDEPVLGTGSVRRIVAQGLLVGAVGLSAFLLSLKTWGLPLEEARTATFITLTTAQLLAVFNARTETGHGFKGLNKSPWLWTALAVTVAFEVIALTFAPLREMLGLQWPHGANWTQLMALALLPLVITQSRRVLLRPRS